MNPIDQDQTRWHIRQSLLLGDAARAQGYALAWDLNRWYEPVRWHLYHLLHAHADSPYASFGDIEDVARYLEYLWIDWLN